MKHNYLLFLLSVLFTISIQAQDEDDTSVEKSLFKINFLFPGFGYEYGFDAKNTLYSEVTMGLGYRYNSYYDESTVSFTPMINEQFRHYYNLDKRAAKGKRTAYNSGNFIAMTANYSFQSISTNEKYSEYCPSLTIAPVWGFQRTYKRKFNLEVNLGAGLNFDRFDTEFVAVATCSLGWVIGK